MTAIWYTGDALTVLRTLPANSVDLVLTSPPFLALRSYLDADHPDKALEIGSEATPGEFLDVLLDVTEELARVLAPHGSICIELGDTYSGSGVEQREAVAKGSSRFGGHGDMPTLPGAHGGTVERRGIGWPLAKSLCMIPSSYAWALAYGRNPWTGRTTPQWRVRNDVIWARPNPPVGCVDAQTEALTLDGWKREDELRDGDIIAVYDPATDSCRFQPATFIRWERAGEPMVAVEKRSTSQRLTLDHRSWTRTRKRRPHVRLAGDLSNDCDTLLAAPFEDVPGPAPVTATRAALLGWFIAEGTPHHHQARIIQSATVNPQKCSAIRGLLDQDGADWRETTYLHPGGTTITTFHVKGELAEWLNLHHKRLPMVYATTWPEAQARALFDALVDGDGHRRKTGRGHGILFHQRAEAVADAVQVLALRLGYRATKTFQPSMQLWQVTIGRHRWTAVRKWDGVGIPRETYTGVVWCPQIETTFWLARRSGKTFITGNSLGDKFRPATSHLTIACKSAKRYFDLDAVREPGTRIEETPRVGKQSGARRDQGGDWSRGPDSRIIQNPAGAPPLDYWEIPTHPYPGAHYATWPPALCVKPIDSMTPRRVCRVCGKPSERITGPFTLASYRNSTRPQTMKAVQLADEHGLTDEHIAAVRAFGTSDAGKATLLNTGAGKNTDEVKRLAAEAKTVLGGYFREFVMNTNAERPDRGWSDCGHDDWRSGVVLDPFAGSGTTLAVATGMGRDAIGIDLDPDNLHLARERVGLFLQEAQAEEGAASPAHDSAGQLKPADATNLSTARHPTRHGGENEQLEAGHRTKSRTDDMWEQLRNNLRINTTAV